MSRLSDCHPSRMYYNLKHSLIQYIHAPSRSLGRSYSMVGTFVRGMAMALVDDRPWDYFVPLSPSDYPAIHTESIRAALAHTARFQLSFVDSRTSERFRYRSFRTCLDPSSFSSTGTRFEIRRGHLFGTEGRPPISLIFPTSACSFIPHCPFSFPLCLCMPELLMYLNILDSVICQRICLQVGII